MLPDRGLIVQTDKYSRLVTTTGASLDQTRRLPLPRPLHVHLHRHSTFTDLHYLAEQVLKFTGLSWRSTLPASDPGDYLLLRADRPAAGPPPRRPRLVACASGHPTADEQVVPVTDAALARSFAAQLAELHQRHADARGTRRPRRPGSWNGPRSERHPAGLRRLPTHVAKIPAQRWARPRSWPPWGSACRFRERLEAAGLWLDGMRRLMTRDPVPADRNSFFFRPVELLGLAAGQPGCRRQRRRADPAGSAACWRAIGDLLAGSRRVDAARRALAHRSALAFAGT